MCSISYASISCAPSRMLACAPVCRLCSRCCLEALMGMKSCIGVCDEGVHTLVCSRCMCRCNAVRMMQAFLGVNDAGVSGCEVCCGDTRAVVPVGGSCAASWMHSLLSLRCMYCIVLYGLCVEIRCSYCLMWFMLSVTGCSTKCADVCY